MSMYHRLFDAQNIDTSFEQTNDEVLDAGAYSTLEVHCRILSQSDAPGPNGTLKLQTAAVNEHGAWTDLTGASWALSTSGGFEQVTSFLRYVRVVVTGQTAGSAVALVDLVAKS